MSLFTDLTPESYDASFPNGIRPGYSRTAGLLAALAAIAGPFPGGVSDWRDDAHDDDVECSDDLGGDGDVIDIEAEVMPDDAPPSLRLATPT